MQIGQQQRGAPLSAIATTKPILAITSQGLKGFNTFAETQLSGAQTVELNKSTVVFTENANLQGIALYGRRNTLRIADGKVLTLAASDSGRSLLFDASIDALGSGYIAVSKLSGSITGIPTALQAPRLLNNYVTAPVRFMASQGNALTLDRTRVSSLTNDSQEASNVATVYLLPGSSIDSVGLNINVVQVGGGTGSGTPGTGTPFGPLTATGVAGESFALPVGTKSVRAVTATDASPQANVNPCQPFGPGMYTLDTSVSPPTLTVLAAYALDAGDLLEGIAFATGSSGGGGTGNRGYQPTYTENAPAAGN